MLGQRWNVEAAEVARHYPCDDVVTAPAVTAWRGITVAAAQLHVWRWVTQLRLAPYSYDWIDNLGRPSPRTLLELPPPVPGEHFTTAFGRPMGRIVAVDAPNELTGLLGGFALTYAVSAIAPDRSRLVLKLTGGRRRVLAPALVLGDLVMARRQLLRWQRLAEAAATPPDGTGSQRTAH